MRDHLARSLERIGEMAGPVLTDAVDMPAAVDHLRRHRVQPGVFARYYELVFALQAGDYPLVRKLWREIAELCTQEPGLSLAPFGPETLGEDAERFDRLFSSPPRGASMLAPPTSQNWESFRRKAPEALRLLQATAPAWSEEVEGLLSLVIAAEPHARPGARWFAGASCLMAWGCMTINVGVPRERLGVLTTVVHEATHQLLFALSREEPLVQNPPEARYRSPLRTDPRPMDGVFHATYVAARLSLLCEILSGAGPELLPSERALVDERLHDFRRSFQAGYSVVSTEAMLTPLGAQLIQEAADHVLAAA